jgi:hypothetical protein
MKYSLFLLAILIEAQTCNHTMTAGGGNMSSTQLKYKLIDSLGDVAFCDPDFFPIVRPGLEMRHAVQLFDSIKNNKDEFSAITLMLKIDNENYSDSNKLEIYREYKRLSAITIKQDTSPFSFSINTRENNRMENMWHYEGTITTGGKIFISKKEPFHLNCPICLPGNTLIKTPDGNVAVSNLKVGDEVVSFDDNNCSIIEKIVQTSKIPVAEFHELIQLQLNDGRLISASPGHPLTNGKSFEEIKIGDLVNGSIVKNINLIFSRELFTYDILPGGPTGFYVANGVEIGSTLKSLVLK